MTTPESPRLRSRMMLALIFAVCAIPFVASYALYYLWPPQSRINYGTLIEPRAVPSVPLARLDGSRFSLAELKGRWLMLQIDASECAAQCRRKLYLMRQLRLMQGRNMDRVERVWLVRDAGAVAPELLRDYVGTHVVRAGSPLLEVFPSERDPTDHIYLMDPLGNLMLRFPKDADPGRVHKDIERLLKISG